MVYVGLAQACPNNDACEKLSNPWQSYEFLVVILNMEFHPSLESTIAQITVIEPQEHPPHKICNRLLQLAAL